MPRLLSRFSTSTLMGIAFTLPAMLIAGLMLHYSSVGAERYLAEEGALYGEILADEILSASQRLLRLGSVAAVQEMIENAGSNRTVVHLALVGSDGRVVASNQRAWIGQKDTVIPEPAFPEVSAEARASFKAQHRLVGGGRTLVLVSPVVMQVDSPTLKSTHTGILYLKLNHASRLREIYAGILARGIVSAVGILAISLFLLLWVRAILALPILRVAAFLRRLAAGGEDPPPRTQGPREVAHLIEDVGRMARDLREKQAALEDSEERHRRLLEGAYDAILTADPESGRVLEVNRMFSKLFGYSPEEARELTLKDLHPLEDRERRMAEYRKALADGFGDMREISCVRKRGGRFLVDIRGGPVPLRHRTIAAWILRDATERLSLEEQLRQSQKMESVANLAGGIAHDFNNILTGILGYTRLVLDRLQSGEPMRKQMEIIERSAVRAAELTAQLLTFSRRAESRPAPGDLNEILAPAIESLRPGLPPGVDLVLRPGPSLWTAAVDTGQIRNVLLHLCANAREAMPEGGILTIETANRIVAEEECRVNLEARSGRFVSLIVRDTGKGISPEVRSRIFEPFFTTKKHAKSSGLGLATVYGSVKGHGGWVEVSSEPGRGSTFVVTIPAWEGAEAAVRAARGVPPAAELLATLESRTPMESPTARESPAVREERAAPAATPSAKRQAPPAPRPSGGAVRHPGGRAAAETVLAVDDESTVLALARDVLELQGYRVLTARSGEEALRIYRDHAGEINLVLMDLTMPVMGGRECFRLLRGIDPAVRVVISSGFSSETSASDLLNEGAIDYLQKPFDIDHLAKVIREALGRRAAAAAGGAAPGARSGHS